MPSKTVCNPIDEGELHNLKIPTALRNIFPAQTKTDREHHACLGKLCAIQFMKNKCTSPKFQLLQAKICDHDIKQTEQTMRA